ncbi:hypothetical protein SteCoe_28497 [Stentor coeruleus]|uniref:Uncharacterized protein n=1 Tax=Stentor coeruleus TaxID=5963 RepID=A0A1R2B847_9CILI|nr:hypothetical protein SteCoe_28497 [Stentor coeruleus]
MNNQAQRERLIVSYSKLKQDIIRNLTPLKPKCASKCIKIGIPQNIEKAYEDMQETKHKFMLDREKLRLKLYANPIYKEEPLDIELLKNQNNLYIHNELFNLNLNKTSDLKRKLLSPIKRYYNRSPERAKDIDIFIDHCNEVKGQNEKLVRKIPEIRRSLSRKFERMKMAVGVGKGENTQEFDKSLVSLHQKMIMMFGMNNK